MLLVERTDERGHGGPAHGPGRERWPAPEHRDGPAPAPQHRNAPTGPNARVVPAPQHRTSASGPPAPAVPVPVPAVRDPGAPGGPEPEAAEPRPSEPRRRLLLDDPADPLTLDLRARPTGPVPAADRAPTGDTRDTGTTPAHHEPHPTGDQSVDELWADSIEDPLAGESEEWTASRLELFAPATDDPWARPGRSSATKRWKARSRRDAGSRSGTARPTALRSTAARSTFRVGGRLVGVAAAVLAVVTLAPIGRPDTSTVIAGGETEPTTIGFVAPSTSTTAPTTTVAAAGQPLPAGGPDVGLEIDMTDIALLVDPEELGFDIEPGTWVEPAIEPEAEWQDSGNGVALPDLLLRIRFCESTNNYRAAHVTSSARGAYQFLSKSWDWYGHAERYGVAEAHLATPAQQDEAALLTYQQVGARPWAESRHCWDDPNIDDRYLTAGPPPTTAPPTTTEPPATSTTADPSSTTTTPTPDSTPTSS